MANDMTKNDWLVANMTSPNNTLGDFMQDGLTVANTQLLSRDEYAKNKNIQSQFITKDDKFDTERFNAFYDGVVQTYNQFANTQFENSVLNGAYFNQTDSIVSNNAKRLSSPMQTSKVHNPYGKKKGIMGMTQESEGDFSTRELAQSQKIWNNKKQKFEEFSANDLWLKSFFTKDTYAIATFKEDGEHYDPLSGRMVKHNKGDYRTNADGNFYYEDLNGDTPYNREILNPFDILTTDGSTANRFDFFDSDSKEKSVTGTVFKTAAFVLPYFIPGFGQAYAGITAAGLLGGTVLPALSKAAAGLFVDNFDSTETGRFMNFLEAKGKAFQTSKSDKDRESMLTMNNIIGMAGDVFGQLAQQRFVAQIPAYLGLQSKKLSAVDDFLSTADPATVAAYTKAMNGAKTLSEKHSVINHYLGRSGKYTDFLNSLDKSITSWGSNLGKSYMTMITASGSYEEAVNQGLDGIDAALFYMGNVATMGAVMSNDVLNIALTKGIGLDDMASFIKKNIKPELEQAVKTTNALVSAGTKAIAKEGAEEVAETVVEQTSKRAAMMNWFTKGKAAGAKVKDYLMDLGNPTLTKDMILESIEEMSEEAAQDAVKLGYNALRAIGVTSSDAEKTTAFGFDNMLERYVTSGLGGAIGGAINYAAYGGSSSLPKHLEKDLVSLIINGQEQKVLEVLESMHKAGQLGSTVLSPELEKVGLKISETPTYKPADGDLPSQNDAIYDFMKKRIKFIKDSIFQEEGMRNGDLYDVYKQRAGVIGGSFKYFTAIEEDIESLANDIVALKSDIANAANDVDASDAEGSSDDLSAKKAELKTKQEELQAILNGDKYEDYVKEALLSVHEPIFSVFGVKSHNHFSRMMFDNKPYAELSSEERAKVDAEYEQYHAQDRKVQVRAAVKQLDKMFGDTLGSMTNLKKYVEEHAAIKELGLESDLAQVVKLVSETEEGKKFLSGLQGETAADLLAGVGDAKTEYDEEGNVTDIKLSQYKNRDTERLKMINTYLTSVKYVDPILKRLIKNSVANRLTSKFIESSQSTRQVKYKEIIGNFKNRFAQKYDSEIQTNYGRVSNNVLSDLFGITINELDQMNLWDHKEKIEKILETYKNNFPDVTSIKNKADEWIQNGGAEDYYTIVKSELFPDGKPDDMDDDVYNMIMDEGAEGEPIISEEAAKSKFYAMVYDYTKEIENMLNTLASSREFLYSEESFELLSDDQGLDAEVEAVKKNLDNKTESPLIELTNTLMKNMENNSGIKNVIGLVSDEINNLASKQLADQYVIDRPSVRWELEKAKDLISHVEALISASTEYRIMDPTMNRLSYGEALAKSMSKGTVNTVELPSFTEQESYELLQDLKQFENRIDNLLALHTYNSNGNVRIQRTVGNKMLTMYSSIFAPDGFGIKALQAAGIDTTEIEDLFNKSENLQIGYETLKDQLADPNAPLVFDGSMAYATNARLEADKITQKVYELVQTKSNPQLTIDKLHDFLKTIDIKGEEPLDFDISTKNLTESQKALYLMMSVGVDPKRFYKDFAGDLSAVENHLTESKYAPFFGQELAAKFSYWSIVSKFSTVDSFNITTKALLNDNFDASSERNAIPSIKAGLFVFGIPGTGKTTAVASSISRIAKSYGLKVAAFAPHASQGDNLASNLGTDNIINTETSVRSLMENILGNELTDELYIASNNAVTDKFNEEDLLKYVEYREPSNPKNDADAIALNINHPKIQDVLENTISIKGSIPDVIVIDEITQVPGPIVQLLDLIVQKHNERVDRKITLLFLGDLEQNGHKIPLTIGQQTMDVNASVSTYDLLSTPVLSQSLRSDYNVNNANIAKIKAFTKVTTQLLKDEDLQTAERVLQDGILFDYIEQDNKMIGYKLEDISPETIIKTLKYTNSDNQPGTVVYIHDLDVTGTDQLKANLKALGATDEDLARLEMMKASEVQGREYDYAIIDIKTPYYGGIFEGENKIELFKNMTRNINTLLTRSRVGSIFGPELKGNTNLGSSNENVIAQEVKLDGKVIADFKQFTIDSIKNAHDNLEDLESNLTDTPSANTQTKSVVPITDEELEFKDVVKEIIGDSTGKNAKLDEYKKITDYKGYYGNKFALDPSEAKINNYAWHSVLGYTLQPDSSIKTDIGKDTLYDAQTRNLDAGFLYKTIYGGDISETKLTDAESPAYKVSVLYNEIKNYTLSFYQNKVRGKLSDYLAQNIISEEFETIVYPKIKDIDQWHLAIMTKPYDPVFDKDVSNTDPDTTVTPGKLISYLVLVSPKTDSNGSPDGMFTLSAFGNPNNPIIQSQLPNVVNSFTEIAKKHTKYLEDNNLQPHSRSFMLLNQGKRKSEVMQATTNLNFAPNNKLEVDDKGNVKTVVEYMTLDTFDRRHPHLAKSEHFIITDDILQTLNIDGTSDDDAVMAKLMRNTDEVASEKFNLKGYLGRFITADKSMELDNLNDYLAAFKDELRTAKTAGKYIPGKIRLQIVRPKGNTLKETLEINREFARKMANQDESSSVNVVDARMNTNDYAAAMIIARIVNAVSMKDSKGNYYLPNSITDKARFINAAQHMVNVASKMLFGTEFAHVLSDTDKYGEPVSLAGRLESYLDKHDKSIRNMQSTYYTPDVKGYFASREHFIAKDILKQISKRSQYSAKLVEESINGIDTKILSPFDKQAVHKVFAALRVAIGGGRYTDVKGEVTVISPNLAANRYDAFLDDLEAVITGGKEHVQKGNKHNTGYNVLFPEGIHLNIFAKKGKGYLDSESIGIKAAVGDTKDLMLNYRVLMPNMMINQADFSTPYGQTVPVKPNGSAPVAPVSTPPTPVQTTEDKIREEVFAARSWAFTSPENFEPVLYRNRNYYAVSRTFTDEIEALAEGLIHGTIKSDDIKASFTKIVTDGLTKERNDVMIYDKGQLQYYDKNANVIDLTADATNEIQELFVLKPMMNNLGKSNFSDSHPLFKGKTAYFINSGAGFKFHVEDHTGKRLGQLEFNNGVLQYNKYVDPTSTQNTKWTSAVDTVKTKIEAAVSDLVADDVYLHKHGPALVKKIQDDVIKSFDPSNPHDVTLKLVNDISGSIIREAYDKSLETPSIYQGVSGKIFISDKRLDAVNNQFYDITTAAQNALRDAGLVEDYKFRLKDSNKNLSNKVAIFNRVHTESAKGSTYNKQFEIVAYNRDNEFVMKGNVKDGVLKFNKPNIKKTKPEVKDLTHEDAVLNADGEVIYTAEQISTYRRAYDDFIEGLIDGADRYPIEDFYIQGKTRREVITDLVDNHLTKDVVLSPTVTLKVPIHAVHLDINATLLKDQEDMLMDMYEVLDHSEFEFAIVDYVAKNQNVAFNVEEDKLYIDNVAADYESRKPVITFNSALSNKIPELNTKSYTYKIASNPDFIINPLSSNREGRVSMINKLKDDKITPITINVLENDQIIGNFVVMLDALNGTAEIGNVNLPKPSNKPEDVMFNKIPEAEFEDLNLELNVNAMKVLQQIDHDTVQGFIKDLTSAIQGGDLTVGMQRQLSKGYLAAQFHLKSLKNEEAMNELKDRYKKITVKCN